MRRVFVIPFLIMGFFIILITSCNNDNPVNQSQGIQILDSNVFDWKFDTVHISFVKDFFVGDSNKIFIPGGLSFVYINGESIQNMDYNDPDFYAFCVNGTDMNNVFIGGSSRSLNKPLLKKWNGAGIEDIPMPNDTSLRISRIDVSSANDVWMSTSRNIIYRYLNNAIIKYTLDSSLDYGTIYVDEDGNVYAQFLDYLSSGSRTSMIMYKFKNDGWAKICKDDFDDNSEMTYFMGFCNRKMLRSGKSSIYYFTGNNWEKYVNFGNDINPLWNAGGTGPQNILFEGEEKYQSCVFYYNGNQIFRIPSIVLNSSNHTGIQQAYGRFYITCENSLYGNFMAIGKLRTSKN